MYNSLNVITIIESRTEHLTRMEEIKYEYNIFFGNPEVKR